MAKDTMYIYASYKKIDGDKKNQIDEDLTYSSEEDAIKHFVNRLSNIDDKLKEKFDNGEDIKIYLHQLNKNNEPYYYKTVEVEKDNDSESGYDIDDEEEVELPDDFVPYGDNDDSKEDTSDEKEGSKETEQETSSEEKPENNEKQEPEDTDGKKDKKTDKEENKDQQSDTSDDVQDLKESVMALSDEFFYHPEFTESIAKRASYIMQEFGLNDKETMNESLSYMAEGVDQLLNKLEESAGSNIETRLALCAINQYFTEKTLKAKDRNALDTDEFGIPSLRKYPIPDKAHVTAAVQRFNYVDKAHEKELAANLIKALKKYDMLNEIQVSDKNRFKKYLDSAYKEFKESYDVHPFPTELTTEFSVGAMLPMMGSTEGWGTKLANTPIEDVVAANNVDMEKYATLYDTSELENDAINYRKKLYTGTSFDDGLITRESVLYEGVIPHRNIIFDKEVETFVKAIKDYISNPKNDFLEDILKKSLNFKKNIYTIRLKEQDGKDSNKIINKIKSSGFREVDDQGVKAIFEKEVKGLLVTMVYDTVGDKIRITYEPYDKDKELKESVNDVFNEAGLIDSLRERRLKKLRESITRSSVKRKELQYDNLKSHILDHRMNEELDIDFTAIDNAIKKLEKEVDQLRIKRPELLSVKIADVMSLDEIANFNSITDFKNYVFKNTNPWKKTLTIGELLNERKRMCWWMKTDAKNEIDRLLLEMYRIDPNPYASQLKKVDALYDRYLFIKEICARIEADILSDDEIISTFKFISNKMKNRPIQEIQDVYMKGLAFKESTINNTTNEATKDDIDEDIRSLVDKLNQKGYKTKYSCSGHTKARIKEDGLRNGIYNGKLYTTARIVFDDDYKLSPPKGWKVKTFDGKIGIYPIAPNYEYKDGVPDDAFEKWKNDYMAELKLWVNDLPDKPGPTEESVDSILDEFYDTLFEDAYLIEKKTREEYAVRRFKEKHKYDDKEKTITDKDGKKYKIDMDYKNTTMDTKSDLEDRKSRVRRTTSAEVETEDPTIFIDKNFFKLKNDKRRESILQHEIAHTKLHNKFGNAKNVEKDLKTSKFINKKLDGLRDMMRNDLLSQGYDPKVVEDYIKNDRSFNYYLNDIDRAYAKGGLNENQVRAKLRSEAMKKLKKYDKGTNTHQNTDEFEADRYAANKTSEKDLKKAIREDYKHTKKEYKPKNYAKREMKTDIKIRKYDGERIPNYKDMSKEDKVKYARNIQKNREADKKEQNKIAAKDYNQRQKALKDKSLTQKEKDNYR